VCQSIPAAGQPGQVCSLFHQRYADFTQLLVPELIKMCSPPAKVHPSLQRTV